MSYQIIKKVEKTILVEEFIDINLAEYIGLVLKTVRTRQGLNQTQLSDLTKGELTGSAISNIEAGKGLPMVGSLDTLAGALGIHITDFFPPKDGLEPEILKEEEPVEIEKEIPLGKNLETW